MAGQPGFLDADERLKALSVAGDPLRRLAAVVDFEVFRAELEAALSRSEGEGRSPISGGGERVSGGTASSSSPPGVSRVHGLPGQARQ